MTEFAARDVEVGRASRHRRSRRLAVARRRLRGEYDRALAAPTAAQSIGRVADDRPAAAAADRSLLQLAVGEESHPFAIGRKNGSPAEGRPRRGRAVPESSARTISCVYRPARRMLTSSAVGVHRHGTELRCRVRLVLGGMIENLTSLSRTSVTPGQARAARTPAQTALPTHRAPARRDGAATVFVVCFFILFLLGSRRGGCCRKRGPTVPFEHRRDSHRAVEGGFTGGGAAGGARRSRRGGGKCGDGGRSASRNSTQPNAQMSVRWSTGGPRACSGSCRPRCRGSAARRSVRHERRCGVAMAEPVVALASPKSSTLTMPSS